MVTSINRCALVVDGPAAVYQTRCDLPATDPQIGVAAEENLDLRFGAIAALKGFISKNDLRKAVQVQRLAREKAAEHIAIGKVLVTMKLLDPAQVAAVLAIQKELIEEAARETDLSEILAAAASEKTEHKAPVEEIPGLPDQPIDSEFPNQPGAQPPAPVDAPAQPQDNGDDRVGLVLDVSPDLLSAVLRRQGGADRQSCVEDVLRILDGAGIAFGVIRVWQIRAFLQTASDPAAELVVAKGKPAVAGNPGRIRLHFSNDYLQAGTIRENGTMDWKDRGTIPQVHEGDLLADIEEGHEGEPGITVSGLPIAPPPLQRLRLRGTKNIDISADGRQARAKTGGMPRLVGDDLLDIFQTLVIEDNVGLETGHVAFDGHVDVGGTVERGFCVTAKSLRAREIEAADVRCSDDIFVADGIAGARIQCGGKIRAGHVHHCRVQVTGDLIVEKEIIASGVETDAWCIIGGGKILASDIVAKKGIHAGDIGMAAARPNCITVGINRSLERKTRDLKDRIKAAQTELSEKEENLAQARERLNRLATDLGLVAQEQDRCMVQARRLEEKLAQSGPENDDAMQTRVMDAIAHLKQKQAGIDETVERYMAEDDLLQGQISRMEEEKTSLQSDLAALSAELEAAVAEAQRENHQAVIKVQGKILSGTRITMPHDSITITEDIIRVKISERIVTDADGSSGWRICFAPTR